MCYKQGVLEHVGSFTQITEKEICACVLCAFVVAKTVLPFEFTQNIDWFKTACSHVLHMHVLHIAVDA